MTSGRTSSLVHVFIGDISGTRLCRRSLDGPPRSSAGLTEPLRRGTSLQDSQQSYLSLCLLALDRDVKDLMPSTTTTSSPPPPLHPTPTTMFNTLARSAARSRRVNMSM